MDRTTLQKVMESLGDEEFANATISISFLVICPVQKNFFKPTEGLWKYSVVCRIYTTVAYNKYMAYSMSCNVVLVAFTYF